MYVLITSLVPVDWRPGHQLKGPFPCIALKSTDLGTARKEAYMTTFEYGSHLMRGVGRCVDVVDPENRMYIFECPGFDNNPKGPLSHPPKMKPGEEKKVNPWL